MEAVPTIRGVTSGNSPGLAAVSRADSSSADAIPAPLPDMICAGEGREAGADESHHGPAVVGHRQWRPMLRTALARARNSWGLGSGSGGGYGGLDDIEGGDELRKAMSAQDDLLLPGATDGYDRQLNALKGLIAEDPARVAEVMRQWVNVDD